MAPSSFGSGSERLPGGRSSVCCPQEKSSAGTSETDLFMMPRTSCQMAHKNLKCLDSQISKEQREWGKQALVSVTTVQCSEHMTKPSPPTPPAGRRKKSIHVKQRIACQGFRGLDAGTAHALTEGAWEMPIRLSVPQLPSLQK